ncbi:MAG TPA: CocE/NonD family hydrolase [Solimonas sp.]|nr:CocE/NonD family hydrolase [Solimonas sp.]
MSLHTPSRWLAAVAVLLLAGCGSSTSTVPASSLPPAGTLIPASSMDLTIDSPAANVNDALATTAVRATVFIPEHVQGATYPLILHSHGWGGSRVSQADVDAMTLEPGSSVTSFFTLIDQQVKVLWQAGYGVVSFTERGHGRGGDDGDEGTADGAHTMSPDYEIRDAQAVIDWAVANMDLTLDAPGDPRMGAIGGSYGGGYQLLLAAVDPRVDAIIPGATWNSLETSLGPNRVIKKGYAFGLCVLATTDQIELSPETQTSCQDGAFNQTTRFEEELSEEGQRPILEHGLAALEADPTFHYPQVDALLVQGNRDILFDLGQAFANYAYLSRSGGDVRLLTHQNGHSLTALRAGPGSQLGLGPNTCGQFDDLALYKAWFDAKLKGQTAGIALLPQICIALDDTTGVNLAVLPRGDAGHTVTVPDATVVTAAEHNNTQSPADEALFIPLADPIAGDDQVLAGTPEALITLAPVIPGGPEGVVFIGLGIKRGADTILVDDQVVPVRSSDPRAGATPQAIDLVPVGEKLLAGDQLGVLLYGDHDQFENEARTLYQGNLVSIAGTFKLPVFTASVHVRVP